MNPATRHLECALLVKVSSSSYWSSARAAGWLVEDCWLHSPQQLRGEIFQLAMNQCHPYIGSTNPLPDIDRCELEI